MVKHLLHSATKLGADMGYSDKAAKKTKMMGFPQVALNSGVRRVTH